MCPLLHALYCISSTGVNTGVDASSAISECIAVYSDIARSRSQIKHVHLRLAEFDSLFTNKVVPQLNSALKARRLAKADLQFKVPVVAPGTKKPTKGMPRDQRSPVLWNIFRHLAAARRKDNSESASGHITPMGQAMGSLKMASKATSPIQISSMWPSNPQLWCVQRGSSLLS